MLDDVIAKSLANVERIYEGSSIDIDKAYALFRDINRVGARINYNRLSTILDYLNDLYDKQVHLDDVMMNYIWHKIKNGKLKYEIIW